jgi:plastocyanin
MRRAASILAVGGAVLVPGAAPAHPGHGPEVVAVEDSPQRFNPGDATVAIGDPVLWRWTGLLRNHSVTADDGSFDSDPGESPGQISHSSSDQFVHVFQSAGTFRYHCKVHPSMRGTVNVIAVPGADSTPPELRNVRIRPGRVCPRRTARCTRTRAILSFTLSEAGDVLARILRGRRTVRVFDLPAGRGRNLARLRTAGLAPGRYRVRLTAFDRSDNGSRPVTARFRVRRP